MAGLKVKSSFRGTQNDHGNYTMNLTGTNGAITMANRNQYVGLAVTLDNTLDGACKLAGDGDPIFGRILTVEPESSGAVIVGVQTSGGLAFPVAAGSVAGDWTRGVRPVGAGNGLIKNGTVADYRCCVIELAGLTQANKTVTVFFS